MSTWRARIGVVAVFVAGFLCGGVTLSLVRARAVSRALDRPEAWAEHVTRQLGRRLDLTRAQRQQVRAILEESRAESAVALKDVRPAMVSVFDRAQARIREVLDAKQQVRFAEISARRRARFLQRFGGEGAASQPR